MRPKTRVEHKKYFEDCSQGLDSMFKEFGIEQPRCGSGIGLGWQPVAREMFRKLVEAGWDKRLAQIKQKFCQLRVYVDCRTHEQVEQDGKLVWIPNEIGKIIDEAEAQCDKICEVCGKERSKKGIRSGWALCDECGEENPEHVIP